MTRRHVLPVAVSLVALSLLTCTSSDQATNTGGSEVGNPNIKEGLYGYLVNELTGERAKGADVRLFPAYANPMAKLLGKHAANPAALDSVSTDSTGLYLFDSLASGTYSMEATLVDGRDTLYAARVDIQHEVLTFVGQDTLRKPGRIAGTVSVTQGDRSGIFVYVPGTSYIAITDTAGRFTIYSVPPGSYSLSYMGSMFSDTSIAGIHVFADSTTTVPGMVLSVDPNQNARDIYGMVDTTTPMWRSIGHIDAVLTGDSVPDTAPRVAHLDWRPDYQGYSGFIYTPRAGVFWTVTVIAYDTLGRKTGETSVRFNRDAGDISMPILNPANAMPRVNAGPDTVVSINDTVRLHGTATDSFGGRIVKYEWLVKGHAGFVQTSSGDTTIIAPALPDSHYTCVLRATDDDSNLVTDTCIVNVLLDPPVLTVSDTTVSIHDIYHVHYSATDRFGRVVLYRIDRNNDGVFEDSSTVAGTVTDTTGPQAQVRKVVIEAIDDDGNVVTDTARVAVVLDPPVAIVVGPDSVHIDSMFTLKTTGSNGGAFGRIVRYEWSIGTLGSFVNASGNDTSVRAASAETDSFPCVLRVTDDDSLVRADTHWVVCYRDWVMLDASPLTDIWPDLSFGIGFAVSAGGTPYVAMNDGANMDVIRFVGSSWGYVGSAGFTGGIYGPSVVVTSNPEEPYIAPCNPCPLMYSGTQWLASGSGLCPGPRQRLALDTLGRIWDILQVVDTLVGMRLDGGAWRRLGVWSTAMGPLNGSIPVTVWQNSAIVTALCDSAAGGALTLLECTDTGWMVLDRAPAGTAAYCGTIALCSDKGGDIYIACSDGPSDAERHQVLLWATGLWTQLPDAPAFTSPPTGATCASLVVDPRDGSLYYAWDQWHGGLGPGPVLQYRNGRWRRAGHTSPTVTIPQLAMGPGGQVYIAYGNGNGMVSVAVLR